MQSLQNLTSCASPGVQKTALRVQYFFTKVGQKAYLFPWYTGHFAPYLFSEYDSYC